MARIFRLLMALMLAQASAASAEAPTDKPTRKGGRTYSLGMPSLYQPYAGFEMQSYSTGENGELGGLVNLGIDKDLGNQIVGAAALGLQAYGGYRGQDFDGGGRAMFSIPSVLLGASSITRFDKVSIGTQLPTAEFQLRVRCEGLHSYVIAPYNFEGLEVEEVCMPGKRLHAAQTGR